jgi:hypothetical protein
MWLAKSQHEQEAIGRHEREMTALRTAIGELTVEHTEVVNQAKSSNGAGKADSITWPTTRWRED